MELSARKRIAQPTGDQQPAALLPLFKGRLLDMLLQKIRGAMRAVQSERRKFLAGFLPPLVVAAVIAAGLLLYYKQYGASSSSYDNAISKCVRDHTFWNQNSTAREEATAACVRDIPERP